MHLIKHTNPYSCDGLHTQLSPYLTDCVCVCVCQSVCQSGKPWPNGAASKTLLFSCGPIYMRRSPTAAFAHLHENFLWLSLWCHLILSPHSAWPNPATDYFKWLFRHKQCEGFNVYPIQKKKKKCPYAVWPRQTIGLCVCVLNAAHLKFRY